MIQNNIIKYKGSYGFLMLVTLLGILNVLGTELTILSLLTALIEYTIVLFFLTHNDYKKSYFYFLAFVAITLEVDVFLYGEEDAATLHERYSFINLPLIHMYLYHFLAIVYLYMAYKEAKEKKYKLPDTLNWLIKWLIILFVTGSFTIVIAMFINDNGIMNWNYYPKVAIVQILGYITKVSVILTSVYIVCDERKAKECSQYLLLLLVAIAITCVITSLFGFHGYYGEAYIMLSTLAVAYTPFLITFANKNVNFSNKPLLLGAGIVIILVSMGLPTCIGSKWYMIIIAAIVGWIMIIARVKSFWKIGGVAVLGLFMITFLSEPLITLISGGNDFVEWKLTQAVKTMNILGQDSAQEWYEDMDNSPLYRFDELHNTFIEYTEKPMYTPFGKGLGGTIKHHTNLLFWESGQGTFSESQIKMGAYFSMHETLAVMFLQHGVCGVYFFIMMLVLLVRRLYKTPWAIIGIIWIFFYWSYGNALIIGGVAAVLALREEIEPKNNKVSYLRKKML